MGDRLVLVNAADNDDNGSTRQSTSTSRNTGPISPRISHYEELMDGVPCPSCRGTGRIPKELEKTLVALIPLDDKRLQPRRTWVWVILAVFICLFICGLLLFFLIPRTIDLSSEETSVTEVTVAEYVKGEKIVLVFSNSINVSNENFFGIRVVNATSNVMRIVFPDKSQVIGRGMMIGSNLAVPMRHSAVALTLNHTITLTDWSVAVCEMPYGYVRLYFQFTVTFEYFNHREQDTLEDSRLVCCAPSGNCTSYLSYAKDEPGLSQFQLYRP